MIWFYRALLIGGGISVMALEGSTRDDPGIGFAVAWICFITATLISKRPRQ